MRWSTPGMTRRRMGLVAVALVLTLAAGGAIWSQQTGAAQDTPAISADASGDADPGRSDAAGGSAFGDGQREAGSSTAGDKPGARKGNDGGSGKNAKNAKNAKGAKRGAEVAGQVSAKEARRIAHRLKAIEARKAEPTSFRVASFNLLGFGHTAPNGDRKGWANGVVRTGWAITLLNAQQVDVAGLQEFQGPQFRAFQRRTGGSWGAYPGLAFGARPVQNSVIWRTGTWELVESRLVNVPYFGGRPMPMPYVKLRSRETGQEVWFLNVHNPADKLGNARQWRARATAIETALVNRLGADGTPVILTGDLNDRAIGYCEIAMRTTMNAADGGSSDAGCSPPAQPAVDWVFGTDAVNFTSYTRLARGLVSRTSDHPMIVAGASVEP